MDNSSFENEYYSLYTDDTTFSTTDSNGLTQYYYTISIVNGIGIYNYIDSKYQNNLSKWNGGLPAG